MTTCKLSNYNKLNWSATLISFNLFFLDSIFATADVFSKTPRESSDNRGS